MFKILGTGYENCSEWKEYRKPKVRTGESSRKSKRASGTFPKRAHERAFKKHLRLVSISESTRESTNLSQNTALKGPIERALLSLVASTKESTREGTQGKASKRVLGGALDSGQRA